MNILADTTEATGRIRIKTTPEGEPPLEIREAWVGLVLPCLPFLGYLGTGSKKGVLTGAELQDNRCCFSVPQNEAIAILEQHNPDAAKWWRQLSIPQSGRYFCFAEDEAEILSGVTRQKITHVTEEMRGDPNR